MSEIRAINEEQAAHWNGQAGHAWVQAQEVIDGLYRPFEDLIVEAVAGASEASVLDVGCGTGSITVAMARRLGAGARCVGVDISEPMIAAARLRAERDGARATFLVADAQTHAFEPATFDMIVSRFGVMFFEDPVRAFANLRSAATDDAHLKLMVWRSADDNPFMTTAERAAAPLLPDMPARDLNGPGQFAFADPTRVTGILDQSGWAGIDIAPIDVVCTLPEAELLGYITCLGPLGRMLPQLDEQLREQVIRTVRPAFDPYVHGPDVRFTAACWTVSARASTPA